MTVAELDAGIGIQDEETLEVYLTGWLRGCLDRVRLGDMEENTLETYRVHIETMIAPTAQVAARYRAAVVRRSAAALLLDARADGRRPGPAGGRPPVRPVAADRADRPAPQRVPRHRLAPDAAVGRHGSGS